MLNFHRKLYLNFRAKIYSKIQNCKNLNFFVKTGDQRYRNQEKLANAYGRVVKAVCNIMGVPDIPIGPDMILCVSIRSGPGGP